MVSSLESSRQIRDIPIDVQYFPLTEESVVFIVGGYSGIQAGWYAETYNPYIYIFEPQVPHFEMLERMFDSNGKVQIFNFGLSDRNYRAMFGQCGNDSCSAIPYRIDGDEMMYDPFYYLELKDITQFLVEYNIDRIDLLFMNCEGAEFIILPLLIDTGFIDNIHNIKAQIHPTRKGSERFDQIVKDLERTHRIRDNYYPAWVTWVKNE